MEDQANVAVQELAFLAISQLLGGAVKLPDATFTVKVLAGESPSAFLQTIE